MEETKTVIENPQAFPFVKTEIVRGAKVERVIPGMTLRDHFAGQALQGNLASCNPGLIHPDMVDEIARTCYIMADAMLKQRSQP